MKSKDLGFSNREEMGSMIRLTELVFSERQAVRGRGKKEKHYIIPEV